MNINQVAKALVELRESSMSPLFYTGDLREKLGEEGLAEALRLRWMLPDEHSGLLQITNSPGVLGEMRQLAETCVKEGVDQKPTPSWVHGPDNVRMQATFGQMSGQPAVDAWREQPARCSCGQRGSAHEGGAQGLTGTHSKWLGCPKCGGKNVGEPLVYKPAFAETCVKDGKDQCGGKADEEGDDKKEKKDKKPDFLAKLGLRKEVPESYSDASRGFALGHHNRTHIVEIMAPSQMRPLYTSSAPSAPTGAPDEELGVGDDVFCTENGQSYSAKVASVDKDGKMSLSFGDKKPGGNRTAYDRKDLKLAKKLDTSRLAA